MKEKIFNIHQYIIERHMKSIIHNIISICTVLVLLAGCKQEIVNRTENIAVLNPEKTDIDAGLWKPVLLSRPDEFAVAAPEAVTSTTYKQELTSLKEMQQNISSEQEKQIRYWSAGGVLRWNEILRELVAKYNLPPYQNADGTYPIPAAANPFAYPLFPFSNPPYSARAYAYVAAAQYDALIATWHYKKLYNRPALHKSDATIKTNITKTDLPSYPSEAAVLAGVTAEMMTLLFPTEVENINAKAKEQQLSMQLAGAGVKSDMDAGESLGRAIAKKFIARARTDNAGRAVGNPASWLKLETDCIARGDVPWKSLELPVRPPMLPGFGIVKSLVVDSLTLVRLKPGPPPAVNSPQFNKELEEVYSFTKKPSVENTRIAQFWADGVGTYTPPGHWNSIAAEDFIKKNYSEVKWARNMALLNIALMDAGIICWKTKYDYFNPRPCQINPDIKTSTGVPNFPAYISGHSTFSGAAATVLGYLIPENAATYTKMAEEASKSRMVAGIHYRSDCEVGLKVGNQVGNYVIQRAKADGAN